VNFSVLDGWWPEGYNGKNGWCIGDETEHPDHNQQDAIDANSFYETLENEIVPAYYERNAQGIPEQWVKISKESLRSLFTQFSTHTMVWNYTTQYYVPGMRRSVKYCADEGAQLFKFTRWKNRMVRHWKSIFLQSVTGRPLSEDDRIFSAGEEREISVQVYVDGLKPEELRVELILERQDAIHGHQQMEIYPMGIVGKLGENAFEYRVKAKARSNGSYRFNCRILPTHPDLFNRHETRLIKWLD
jgi:starch phosphorylase